MLQRTPTLQVIEEDECENHFDIPAINYLRIGERLLLRGDPTGLEYFELAMSMDPANPDLYYRQGLALFEFGSEEGKEKNLLLAGKKFKTATQIKPHFFEAWHVWGMTLSLLGMNTGEHHYFLDAKEKLTMALSLVPEENEELISEIHWDLALIWKRVAMHSGEAVDFQTAIASFQKASQSLDLLSYEFWSDFGTVCLELSKLVTDVRLVVKAIGCFKHGVSLLTPASEGWANLAAAFEILYGYTHDDDHYAQASECFAVASHLKPDDASLLIRWSHLLLSSATAKRDIKKAKLALEKCQKASALEPKSAEIAALWAWSLALIGEFSEQIEILNEAQNKMNEALYLGEDDKVVWHINGLCLVSFANYFEDTDFYFQAIEKFQEALSIDRTYSLSWESMARCYLRVGMELNDRDSFEKAIRFYRKALSFKQNSTLMMEEAIAVTHVGIIKQDQSMLEFAVSRFEEALAVQKNALYTHPDWLFHYAVALDTLGDYFDDESRYLKAIEALSHILTIDPDFKGLHHRLALVHTHLGDLTDNVDYFYRAIYHYRLACRHDPENDEVTTDFGVCLINLGLHLSLPQESELAFQDAEMKLLTAAKLGNEQALYPLACLHSILGHYETSLMLLEKARVAKSLPPLEELLDDEWLDGLRHTPEFQEFLSILAPKEP